ncbi:MAG: hypothetical protein U0Q22_19050 [Acidimicrobiales bacterium]
MTLAVLHPSVAGASESVGSDEVVEHCVANVTGQEESGEYILSEPECFEDMASAMEYAGLGKGLNTLSKVESAAFASTTIGIHYDGASFTGSSFSVVGVDCGGGYVNMSSSWDNRVSSTISNACGRIRHWTGANKTGSSQDTLPNGNLVSPVNNAVSSIQYLS